MDKNILRHVVIFKFKDGTAKSEIMKIETAFAGLKDKIPSIQDFEWGTNVSPEGKSNGFTHCFLLSFLKEEDRDAYLPHPAHQEFGTLINPYIEKVCVVDYWASS